MPLFNLGCDIKKFIFTPLSPHPKQAFCTENLQNLSLLMTDLIIKKLNWLLKVYIMQCIFML